MKKILIIITIFLLFIISVTAQNSAQEMFKELKGIQEQQETITQFENVSDVTTLELETSPVIQTPTQKNDILLPILFVILLLIVISLLVVIFKHKKSIDHQSKRAHTYLQENSKWHKEEYLIQALKKAGYHSKAIQKAQQLHKQTQEAPKNF